MVAQEDVGTTVAATQLLVGSVETLSVTTPTMLAVPAVSLPPLGLSAERVLVYVTGQRLAADRQVPVRQIHSFPTDRHAVMQPD